MPRGQVNYYGSRRHKDVTVMRHQEHARHRPLDPCYHLRNHSPDGFEWGYGGSGAAQLALALLADATGDAELAQTHYQDFKWRVIAMLEKDEWNLSSKEILEWVRAFLDGEDPLPRLTGHKEP